MVPSVIDYLLQLPEAMHFARVQELCGDGVFFYRMLSEYGNGTFQLIEFEDDLLLILIGDYTPKDTFEWRSASLKRTAVLSRLVDGKRIRWIRGFIAI